MGRRAARLAQREQYLSGGGFALPVRFEAL